MTDAPRSCFDRPAFTSRVVPVIVLTDAAQAVPLAHALLERGVDVMEITLRHGSAAPPLPCHPAARRRWCRRCARRACPSSRA